MTPQKFYISRIIKWPLVFAYRLILNRFTLLQGPFILEFLILYGFSELKLNKCI